MLSWYPPEFGNQTSLVIPGGQLWTPDLQVANSVSDFYALMRDPKFDFKVHNDGSVWWHPTGNLVTRCELNLDYFPFDFQRCPVILESAVFDHTKMNLTMRVDKSPVSMAMYVESGDWRVVRIDATNELLWVTKSTAFTRVEYQVLVERKTSYFKVNIIFPVRLFFYFHFIWFSSLFFI